MVKMPFPFLVLDELATIKGYSKSDESGYWSNQVRNTTKQPFTVRTKAGIVETALYKELKCTAKGAKYAKSVYCAFFDENKELAIGNITFVGAALSAWIEFSKAHKTDTGCVIIEGKSAEKTNGATKYFEPVFGFKEKVSEETEQKALELDKELQTYLTAYFTLQGQTGAVESENDDDYRTQRDKELEDFSEPEEMSQLIAQKRDSHVLPDLDVDDAF